MRNKLIKYFLISLMLTLPVTASAVVANPSEVRTEVMQNCLANGGDKSICECSYNNALKIMTLDDLALLQSQLSSHVQPDGNLMGKFTKATSACGEPGAVTVSASLNNEDSISLPPPPPPPLDPSVTTPITSQNGDKPGNTYLSDIKAETKKPSKIVEEDPSNIEKPLKKTAKSSAKKRPVGYFGEYDRLLFDAAASADINALRAYATKVYDFNAHNEAGDTPLIVAVKAGQPVSVRFFTVNGANVNERNLNGQAPIHIASYMRRPDLVNILIDAKANIKQPYGNGYTPLVLAIMQQDLATVQLLLQNKAGFSKTMSEGNTELHLASAGQNAGIIQALVNAGAKVNQKNKAGYTPLMVASYTGNAAGVQALLALGADANIKDAAGRNALTLANAAGKQNVVNVLMQSQR